MAGRLQNEDFKTLSELTGAGGTSSQLLNDTKIYITNASLANQLSSLITSGDVLSSASLLKLGVTTDSTTTGSNAALAAATKGILRLTNASLTSIATITGMASGQYFVLINRTGATITINDNDVANGIRTGTGANMTVANNAAVVIAYDPTTARSQIIGGSGGSSISTPVSIANGGTGQTTQTAAFNALSPQTTKGDLIAHNGTNDVRVAAGTNGQHLIADSGATEGVRWADPTLSRKYIQNGDAEVGTLGWNTYADAAGSSPVDGTGGAPNISWTRSSSSPLRGTGSFVLTKDAANRQGQGASYDFTIDSADQAKVLQITFDYKVSSGTFVAGNPADKTSAGDSDLTIWIYDITNGVLIQPTTYRLFSNSSTNAAQFSAYFQSSSNSTSYRMIVHCATTSASAYTVQFDQIDVLAAKYNSGTPITDWANYTPTYGSGYGTVSTSNMRWRRVGDSIEIKGTFVTGTLAAANGTISLPSGLSIDTNKQVATDPVGRIIRNASSTTLNYFPLITQTGSSTVAVYQAGPLSVSNATGPFSAASMSSVGGNGETMDVDFKVPIAGWSSTLQLSDSSPQAVVDAVVFSQATITGTAGSPFIFATVGKDSHGAYNASTGEYTCPFPGDYDITLSGAFSNVGDINISVQKDGSYYNNITTTDTTRPKSGSVTVYNCVAGTKLRLVPDVSRNLLYSAGNFTPMMSIRRVAGPVQIAPTDKFRVYGVGGSGQSISNSTNTTLTLSATKDSHGAVASNQITFNTACTVYIKCEVSYSSNTTGIRQVWVEYSTGGGAFSAITLDTVAAASTSATQVTTDLLLDVVAGDKIQFATWQNSGGSLSINTSTTQNRFFVYKIG